MHHGLSRSYANIMGLRAARLHRSSCARGPTAAASKNNPEDIHKSIVNAKYKYEEKPGLSGVPMSKWVPPVEYFSRDYLLERLQESVPLIFSAVTNFVLHSGRGDHKSIQVRSSACCSRFLIKKVMTFLAVLVTVRMQGAAQYRSALCMQMESCTQHGERKDVHTARATLRGRRNILILTAHSHNLSQVRANSN